MMDRSDDFVLVDARDEVHYDRGHIRGAIAIPTEDKPLRAVDVRRPKRLLFRRIMVMHGGDKEGYAEGYRFDHP